MQTRVVNCRREDYDVLITRGTIWGNPVRIGGAVTRRHAIRDYEYYLRQNPQLLAKLPELVGKRLGCVCAPLSCHGDVLIKLMKEKGLIDN